MVAGAVVIAALLAAWAQWQPQSSENPPRKRCRCSRAHPSRAIAAAQAAVARDPLSAQALFALSAVQEASRQPANSPAPRSSTPCACSPPTRKRGCVWASTTSPATNRTSWAKTLPLAALQELGAAIYLNPESIAPEAVADGDPEAIAIQNDYVEALRASNH